jgi:hypothetical protein
VGAGEQKQQVQEQVQEHKQVVMISRAIGNILIKHDSMIGIEKRYS